MKGKRMLWVFAALLMSVSASASYTKNRTIERVWLLGDEVLLAVSSTPSGVCDYYGAYFRFSHTSAEGKGFLSLLLTARSMGANIDLWYKDSSAANTDESSGCSISKLAVVSGVAFTK